MLIGYLRVSTGRQQLSGLGLEAQRVAVEGYARRTGDEIHQTYVETESGSTKRRPQLDAALASCRRTKATLVIAKLDRLARNVAFVSSLMESGVEFIACDAPYANRLMIHILSAFAEHEREQISERTKAALQAAKARGVKLGKNGEALAEKNRRAAETFARSVKSQFVSEFSRGGSLRSIAERLNAKGVPTPRDCKWHAMSVHRTACRLGIIAPGWTSGVACK